MLSELALAQSKCIVIDTHLTKLEYKSIEKAAKIVVWYCFIEILAAGIGVEPQFKTKIFSFAVADGQLGAARRPLVFDEDKYAVNRADKPGASRYGIERVGVVHLHCMVDKQ